MRLYDTISDVISIRDILLDLYDTISDSILSAISYWIYMILYQIQYYSRYLIGFIYYIGFNKYPRYPIGFIWYYIRLNKYPRYPIGFIGYYIGLNNIRDILLDSYDTISDAQPEGQGHSIISAICSPSVNGIIWYYIGCPARRARAFNNIRDILYESDMSLYVSIYVYLLAKRRRDKIIVETNFVGIDVEYKKINSDT